MGGGGPETLAFPADCSDAAAPVMNRFGTRLLGATATQPPPPKARSNENLDKIDMSLGEGPGRPLRGGGGGGSLGGGRGGWSRLPGGFGRAWAVPAGTPEVGRERPRRAQPPRGREGPW